MVVRREVLLGSDTILLVLCTRGDSGRRAGARMDGVVQVVSPVGVLTTGGVGIPLLERGDRRALGRCGGHWD